MEQTGRTIYLAELECFLCGNLAGSVQAEYRPLPTFGIWRPASGAAPQRVADWRSLRCNRCGGALYVDRVEAIGLPDECGEVSRKSPRKGRPPKSLVEQRQRARHATDAHL
jgi:hypothetical protein